MWTKRIPQACSWTPTKLFLSAIHTASSPSLIAGSLHHDVDGLAGAVWRAYDLSDPKGSNCFLWLAQEADSLRCGLAAVTRIRTDCVLRHSAWQLVCVAQSRLKVGSPDSAAPSRWSCLPLRRDITYPCDDSCDSSRRKNCTRLLISRARAEAQRGVL